MANFKTISIGDIHGKDVWKEAIIHIDSFDKVIFVGDYVDSFDVTGVVQKHNLLEIIELKKQYPNKVILLLGNHDVQYMHFPNYRCSGFQSVLSIDYTQIFRENRELFQAAYQIGNNIWTHAGIHIGWYNEYCKKYQELHPEMTLADILNHDYELNKPWIFVVGHLRGGRHNVGGPLWLDRRQLWNKPILDYHQIVGHTRITDGSGFKYNDNFNGDTSVTCIDLLEDESPQFYTKNCST
jgi:predicted MPP superfamily phosphohydrolase